MQKAALHLLSCHRAVLGVGHAIANHLADDGDVDATAVPFVDIVAGLDRQLASPWAPALMAVAGTPSRTRASLTASARRRDSVMLHSGKPAVLV